MRRKTAVLLACCAGMLLGKVAAQTAEKPAVIAGKNLGRAYFYKVNQVRLTWPEARCTPFERAPRGARLEMYAKAPCELDAIQFVTPDAFPEVLDVFLWDEERQEYEAPRRCPVRKVTRGYVLDAKSFGYRHRVALEFPGMDAVTLDDVRALAPIVPDNGWQAEWIWFTKARVEDLSVCFHSTFELEKMPVHAMLQFTADDNGTVWLNGVEAGRCGAWHSPVCVDVLKSIKVGRNDFAAVVGQARYAAGFLAELDLVFADGSTRKIITSPEHWRCTLQKPADGWNRPGFDDSAWQKVISLGRPEFSPWGNKVPYRVNTPRKALEVTASPLPEVLEAGKRCTGELRLRVQHAPELPTPVEFQLKRDGRIYWEAMLGKLPARSGESAFLLDFPVNPFLIPGNYQIELSAVGYEQQKGEEPYRWTVRIDNPRKAATADARLQKIGGTMTLTIDGEPHFMMFSARRAGLDVDRHARLFRGADMHLYHAYILPAWYDPETPDFGPADAAVTRILAGDPDARIVLKLALRDCQPVWLLQKYPEEAVVFDNGRRSVHVSLASTVWRAIVDQWITGLVKHVADSPYADRIIGYFVYEGEEGQWMHYWSGNDLDQPGTLSDYGKPMLTYFRDWLKNRYRTDAALQKAWHDPVVTLETAPIPSREQRIRGDHALRDPVRDRAAIDFAEALSDVIAEGVEHYCKLVKDLTGGKALTGAMYGHIMDLGGHFLGESVGYLKQRRVIESPYVDVALGPISYARCFRDVGGTASFDAPSPASLALHGKMWMNEDDVRTHLCFPPEYAYSIRTPEATSQMLAREVFKALCGQAGLYLFSLGDDWLTWYDDPETVRTLKSLRKVADAAMLLNRHSISEIAVFMDDFSIAGFRLRSGEINDGVQSAAIFQRYFLSRIGAPFDEYMLSDATDPDLPDYKLYLFLNPLMMSPEQVRAIQAKLARTGATAVWYYAPGIFTGEGLSVETAQELTRIRFAIDRTPRPMAFKDVKNAIVTGNAKAKVSPTLRPDGFDEVLSVWADGTNAPAAVRKGNAYFSALGHLSTAQLRSIARRAGVEILSENDIAVYANASLLAVHSDKNTGDYAVKAPQGQKLRMLWPEPEAGQANPDWTEYRWHNTHPVSMLFEIVDEAP